jgi:ketosteroid isomerase-like protein
MTPLAARARRQISLAIADDWPALAALYHPDAGYRDPDVTLTGRDDIVERLRGQVEAMPGCGAAVSHTHTADGHAPDDGTAGSGTVVVEWTLSAPTGADTGLTLDIVTVYEFRDGLIAAERNYWDHAHLASQLSMEAGA